MLNKWDTNYYAIAKTISDNKEKLTTLTLPTEESKTLMMWVDGLARQYIELYNRVDTHQITEGWVEDNLTDGHNAKPGDAVVYADDLMEHIKKGEI